jgi:18S rRNA (guanine1575-N7)-methyltransferase
MREIQTQMTHRAIELLALPAGEPKLLLDVGCGSGLSGEVLTEMGHVWIGFDISQAMLCTIRSALSALCALCALRSLRSALSALCALCALRSLRSARSALCALRSALSALSALCALLVDEYSASTSESTGRRCSSRHGRWMSLSTRHVRWCDQHLSTAMAMQHRQEASQSCQALAHILPNALPMSRAWRTVRSHTHTRALTRMCSAVFQFYPQDEHQVKLITDAAIRCGFSGGVVVDFPNSTKAKKFFLCLFAGTPIGSFESFEFEWQ